ncbi:hypothetical protein [Streptomyces sp. NPDC091383]|uniref:hypothetical protein n=1 Tax=Streptomyces sp. NPDC091383 TaxID=3365996 RepID=UPI00382013DC
MAHRHANDRLAALLQEAGWTNGELAHAVNTLGAAEGLALRYDRTSVAHWLSGTRPRPPVPDLVAAALTQRTDRLVIAEDTGFLPHAYARGPLPGSDPGHSPLSELIALCRQDCDPVRRAALTSATFRVAPPPPPVPPPGPAPAPEAVAAPLPPAAEADVAMLDCVILVAARSTGLFGGRHARSALAQYLADDISSQSRHTRGTRLEPVWLTRTAQLTHLLALKSEDTGHSGLAQQYFRTALALASAGGDRVQYAVTLRAMSCQAARLGHTAIAHAHAEQALAAAGDLADPGTRAYLLAQRAHTHALRQDGRRALADLDTAAQLHEPHGTASGAPPRPFASYPRAGLEYQQALVLLHLREHERAIAHLAHSFGHRAPGERRALALTHALMADALLGVGRLDEACVHGHRFLDESAPLDSARVHQALAHLCGRLTPHRRTPAAAAVLERARAYGADSRPVL